MWSETDRRNAAGAPDVAFLSRRRTIPAVSDVISSTTSCFTDTHTRKMPSQQRNAICMCLVNQTLPHVDYANASGNQTANKQRLKLVVHASF